MLRYVKRYDKQGALTLYYPKTRRSIAGFDRAEQEGLAINDPDFREYCRKPFKSRAQVQRIATGAKYFPRRKYRYVWHRHYNPLHWQTPERAEHIQCLHDFLNVVGIPPQTVKTDYTEKRGRGKRKAVKHDIDFDVMTFDFDDIL